MLDFGNDSTMAKENFEICISGVSRNALNSNVFLEIFLINHLIVLNHRILPHIPISISSYLLPEGRGYIPPKCLHLFV